MIPVTPTIALDEAEIEERFIRAGGPGGQNVNKVSSAVQLRFDAARSKELPDDVRARLKRLAGRRMTRDGVVVIEAQRYRTQDSNRRDALARLVRLVQRAAEPPVPRKKTRLSPAQRRRRLEAKRRRAALKRARGPVSDAES
ncbi:MAG TPA: alternative ribosome rescue aminoacyl-tRNA hydrolase ArfB [Rhodospirillales bacterium]|jgi:ribosome-associated protein|nr:alternative ribosome rescue aminoacyl-tRNA hydrolase ArfB [Rhodospirillales bacterium]